MESFVPASFPEALGGGLLIVATISALFSLCPCLRAHALRLLAIFIVASLALFSNNTVTYFVAIFVISTAVTELEFLQTLAAIVRGNKDYFDYKKETLSVKDKMDSLASEVKQESSVADAETVNPKDENSEADFQSSYEESSEAEDLSATKSRDEEFLNSVSKTPTVANVELKNMDSQVLGVGRSEPTPRQVGFDIRKIYDLESRALDKLEVIYGRAIERGVLIKKSPASLQLDGLISRKDTDSADMIFEVKYLATSRNFISWSKRISPKLNMLADNYRAITGKTAWVHLVIILDQSEPLTLRQKRELDLLQVKSVTVFYSSELN